MGMGLCATLTLFAAGCDSDDDDGARQFRVRIENVSPSLDTSQGAQPATLSPGVWAVFNGDNPLFSKDDPASVGLERLAEDGDPGPLQAEILNAEDVEQVGVFGQNPIGAGGTFDFTITARPGDRFAFVTQYAATNDLFVSTEDDDGITLFDNLAIPLDIEELDDFTLWDAGTEVNEEPGVGASTKPNQPSNNFGTAENSVIMPVEDTIDPFIYPAGDSIIRVSIELLDD